MGEEAISIIPGVAWVAFAFVALWVLRAPIAERLSRVRSVSALGVHLTMDPAAAADELATAGRDRGVSVDAGALTLLAERAAGPSAPLEAMRILWIDDNPVSVVHERRALTNLGASVDTVTTDADAWALLRADPTYGLLLSDIRRGGDAAAGVAFAARVRELDTAPPVILYTGTAVQPPPTGVRAVVDRPDDLLREILRVAEGRRRQRGDGTPGP